MKLIEGFDSNYRYILVAARRARQLQGGAPPVIETPSRKPCRIAQDEIRAGKVKWVIPEMPRWPKNRSCGFQIVDFRFQIQPGARLPGVVDLKSSI
jgi:DNA-directed RNA polymerase subunit omega